jgi:hypothetical protein
MTRIQNINGFALFVLTIYRQCMQSNVDYYDAFERVWFRSFGRSPNISITTQAWNIVRKVGY